MPAAEDFNKNAEQGASEQEEWFGLGDDAFTAVPRPAERGDTLAIRGILPLPVGDTEAYRRSQSVVDAALVILSQSPTARKLAATAISKGYSIIVDPPVISGAGVAAENVALGSTDALNKRVNLKSMDDPVQLALVIAHELAHVNQMEKAGMPFVVSPFHPLASIKNLMAMEGDARAYEFLVAIELSYMAKGDPDERLVFPKAIDIAAENIGGVLPKRVIEHFKPRFPDAVDKADIMARIFKSSYGSTDLRQHYENTILHAMGTAEQLKPGTYKNETKFTRDIASDDILKALDSHTVAYLQTRAKFIDLDGPQMTALAPATIARLAEIEKTRRENPLVQNERPWTDAPSYGDVAPKPETRKTPSSESSPRAMSPSSSFGRAAATPDAPIGPHGETVLHLAAQEGKAAEAAKAIAAGATVFIMDQYNNSPLLYAAKSRAADVIREIVQADKKGIDYSGNSGTALGLAAQGGDIESARALIDGGANINAPDDMGATPLMNAVFNREQAMVDYLILRGADVNVLRMGEGALHLAVRGTGDGINEDTGIILSLLAAGAAEQLNQQTRRNKLSPLHVAVLSREYAAAEELLKAGAMTSLENVHGLTPVELAALQGDAKMIRLLVERGHADLRVTSGEYKFTALHRAVSESKETAARELVRLGADPEAKDSEGRNALELAAGKGDVALVKYFAAELSATPASLASALRRAAMEDRPETVTLLLSLGANPLLKDADNRTALQLARQKSSDGVIPLLEQAEKDYVMRHNFPKSSPPSP